MKNAIAVLLSAATGYLVWALAPALIGEPLPWDAPWPFYSVVMAAGGLASSLFSARGWMCAGAAWFGQVLALVVLPLDRSANMMGVGAWWWLGVFATGIGAVLLGVGFALGRYAFGRYALGRYARGRASGTGGRE